MAKEGIVKALWYYSLNNEKGNFVKSPMISSMPTFIDVFIRKSAARSRQVPIGRRLNFY
tara:strand:- start:205 stop:381 length:177 start_codon:yes stop_codon:yes gene_type:complete